MPVPLSASSVAGMDTSSAEDINSPRVNRVDDISNSDAVLILHLDLFVQARDLCVCFRDRWTRSKCCVEYNVLRDVGCTKPSGEETDVFKPVDTDQVECSDRRGWVKSVLRREEVGDG